VTYLVKRNNMYYFRIVVPSDLQTYISRKEIVKSLKTSYFDQARELARQTLRRIDRLFTIFRNIPMDNIQINEMISAFYRSSIKKGDLDSLTYE
jgi:hypothetical protein